MSDLLSKLSDWSTRAQRSVAALDLSPQPESLGRVSALADGVVQVQGLPQAQLGEVLRFASGVLGMVVVLDEDQIGCVLLGRQDGIAAGSPVRGSGQVMEVPVGDSLLGRVVDPLGQPLDGGPAIQSSSHLPIERAAPSITERQPVTEPLHTGITAIDAMLPLGRGQRELIIGDRFTGKTAIAVDTIISQSTSDVICVYAAIGQRSSSVAQAVQAIRERGPKARTICVVAASDAAAGLQWLAPYAACSMAEYFSDRGRHVLLVLDDLTKHA